MKKGKIAEGDMTLIVSAWLQDEQSCNCHHYDGELSQRIFAGTSYRLCLFDIIKHAGGET